MCAHTNVVVGRNWTQRLEKAVRGELDAAGEAARALAVADARLLLEAAAQAA